MWNIGERAATAAGVPELESRARTHRVSGPERGVEVDDAAADPGRDLLGREVLPDAVHLLVVDLH